MSPYEKFTVKREGKRTGYAIRNKETGAVTVFKTQANRTAGIRNREAIAHGWEPTRK